MSDSEPRDPLEISPEALEAAAAAAAEATSRALGIPSPLGNSETMGYGLLPPQGYAAAAVAPFGGGSGGGYAGLEASFHQEQQQKKPPPVPRKQPQTRESALPLQHQHHMGKKPPPNKNKKRKPTAKAAAAAAAPPKRSARPPKRPLSRQGSSNLSSRTRNIPRLTITNDEEPDRLTNPLLAMVAESSKKSGGAVNPEENATGASVLATPNTVIPSGELMNSASIVFHRPDTYPLSYLARVLGFDVEVPDMRQFLRQEGEFKEQDAGDNATLPPFPTALPDPHTLPFREDKVFSQIPDLGVWFEQQKLQKFVDRTSGLGDRDDQQLLDYMDPVYKSLLHHGWDSAELTPSTSKASAKFVQQQELQRPVREKLVKTAREELGLSEDWTFRDWASYAQEQEQTRLEQAWLQNQANESALVAATGGTVDKYRSGSVRRKSQPGPMWTIDGKQVFGHLPLHHFGIIVYHKEEAVALFKYQFEWYYLPHSDAQQEDQGTDSNLPMEAELVMVISGFGKPVKQKQVSDSTDGISASSENADGASNMQEDILMAASDAPLDDTVKMLVLAMAFDHTRSCGVWYGVWNVPTVLVDCLKHTFRMVAAPTTTAEVSKKDAADDHIKDNEESDSNDCVPMICDMNKCSSRFVLSKLKCRTSDANGEVRLDSSSTKATASDPSPVRMLVNMPTANATKYYFENLRQPSVNVDAQMANQGSEGGVFTSANDEARKGLVRVRAKIDAIGETKICRVDPTGREQEIAGGMFETRPSKAVVAATKRDEGADNDEMNSDAANTCDDVLHDLKWDFIRYFPVPSSAGATTADEDEDEVLEVLKKKQAELVALEGTLQPVARNLLANVVEERFAYEQPESRHLRAESERILKENEDMVRRRQEMDQVWQDQLEQDMNAVCSICNDGEVTPDNQILFCEACNVAVHQMCYGIEKIPDGDYYCIPCRYFKRDRLMETMSGRHLTDGASAPSRDLPLLKIVCELCPVKQGAYTRTDTPDSESEAKWLHMTCAKWQGLDFVTRGDPSLVEDVTELKRHFRRLAISCCICQGMRGGYIQCRHPGCNKWCHVTCARESGLCEVIHGEDVVGYVDENPWTLLCPIHSDKKKANEDQKKKATSVEFLINAAKEFPVEPMPPPRMEALKPFNKLTGPERKQAFAVRTYEEQFIEEILTKRKAGVRCEVCDGVEDDGKNTARCVDCGCMICLSCQTLDDPDMMEQRFFKCYSCLFCAKKSSNNEDTVTPQCSLCHQKGGLLLHAVANPVSRKSYWKSNQSELKRSLFGTTRFAHILCSFWNKNISISRDCVVDTSNVVLSNGRGFVLDKHRCGLCGLKSGLKTRCVHPTCRARCEVRSPYHFHVTCARQAGLEVSHSDDSDIGFYVNCYVHGSNEHNLRARLEDLIEVEKRRAGKQFTRSDNPMKFTDGSRLLNNAILVMRIMGWAWRWAEWWVECGSTWEPLLEPGQKEAQMTAEELRIVESSPERRRDDARRCRLAAFGAALRNRCYDIEDGFDNAALDRALRAVLNTPSLVGPLEQFEIDFFADWLGRAYRSKSRLLGFGEDKILVSNSSFCRHIDDNSPKFELGGRPLPGKQELPAGQVFEDAVDEPDDFLKPERNGSGEVLEAEPLPEVNYRHGGKKSATLDPNVRKRSAPPRSEITDVEYEQQRKKSRIEAGAGSSSRRRTHVSTAEAIILPKTLEQNLRFRTMRGRPPNVVRLKVAMIVGGERFNPSDENSDDVLATDGVKRETSESNSLDFSQVDLFEVLPMHEEFLRSVDINSAEELMSITEIIPIGAKLVAYRRKKRQSHLQGGEKSAANIISKWRSIVKAYARKRRLFLEESQLDMALPSLSRSARSARTYAESSDSSCALSKDLEVTRKLPKRTDKRKSSEPRAKASETVHIQEKSTTPRKRGRPAKNRPKTSEHHGVLEETKEPKPDSTLRKGRKGLSARAETRAEVLMTTKNSRDRQRKRKMAPLDGTLSSITSPGREFLQEQGITSSSALYEHVPSVLGPIYDVWRKRNGLKMYLGKGADSQVSRWKKLAREKEAMNNNALDDPSEEATLENDDAYEEAQERNSLAGRKKGKESPEKRRRQKLTHSDCFLNMLPDVAIEFLQAQNIDNAKSLLEYGTCELSQHLISWRKEQGMDQLKGHGPASVISSWKGRVRQGAFEAGETELAEIGKVATKRRRKKRRTKHDSDTEYFDEDPDNDLCMYCGQDGNLLICDGCEQSCHTQCLDPPLEAIPEGDFFCPECEAKSAITDKEDVCMLCHKVGELLICDGCEKSCHMRCLNPPLLAVPDGDFFCPECSSKPAAKQNDLNDNATKEEDDEGRAAVPTEAKTDSGKPKKKLEGVGKNASEDTLTSEPAQGSASNSQGESFASERSHDDGDGEMSQKADSEISKDKSTVGERKLSPQPEVEKAEAVAIAGTAGDHPSGEGKNASGAADVDSADCKQKDSEGGANKRNDNLEDDQNDTTGSDSGSDFIVI